MDLGPLYGDFLAYQEARGCSPLTLVAYRQDFNRLREFLQAAKVEPKLEVLTGPLIWRYLVWLREQGFKQWSIRRRISSLRSFLNYCIDEELLERHPMHRVPTPKAPETVPDYLTLEEVRVILQAVDRSKSKFRIRDQALVRVLLFTGVRRAELLGMRWKDLDLTALTLRIRGRGGKERLVPLEPATEERLRALRNGGITSENDLVWRNRRGRAMSPDSLGRIIRRWLRMAGIGVCPRQHGPGAAGNRGALEAG